MLQQKQRYMHLMLLPARKMQLVQQTRVDLLTHGSIPLLPFIKQFKSIIDPSLPTQPFQNSLVSEMIRGPRLPQHIKHNLNGILQPALHRKTTHNYHVRTSTRHKTLPSHLLIKPQPLTHPPFLTQPLGNVAITISVRLTAIQPHFAKNPNRLIHLQAHGISLYDHVQYKGIGNNTRSLHLFSQRPNCVQIHITDMQLIEPSKQRVEQKGIGFEVRFTIVGIEHLLVDIEGAIEEEFATAAESDDRVVERDGDVVAGAGNDLLY